MELRLLRVDDVLRKRGSSKTALYDDVRAGLCTPPVRWGATSSWPEHEIDAILAARIAGKSDDDIRALVSTLFAARKAS